MRLALVAVVLAVWLAVGPIHAQSGPPTTTFAGLPFPGTAGQLYWITDGSGVALSGQPAAGGGTNRDLVAFDTAQSRWEFIIRAGAAGPITYETYLAALRVAYDGTTSGSPSRNVQEALDELFENGGGGGSSTDLSTTTGSSSVTVVATPGADAVIPGATVSAAGVMVAGDKAKLDGIQAGATNDDVPEAGDFDAAAALEADGSLSPNSVPIAAMTDDSVGADELDLINGDTAADEDCLTYEPAFGGNLEFQPCGGGGGGPATSLDQTTGPDFRRSATEGAYYLDVDGDEARATNGTEPFADFLDIEIPRDYVTIQAALNSSDCKRGTTNADQGCSIRVGPSTRAEVVEIGGTTAQGSAESQNSIRIAGAGPAGTETSGGVQACATTLTGDNSANHTILRANNVIGLEVRDLCLDMDESATNDALYGIHLGYDASTTKHVTLEHVTVEDGIVAGGAGLRIGNGASADVPFVLARRVRMENVRTCIEVDSQQAVDLQVDGFECSNPTAAIGGVSVTAAGGEIALRHFFFKPGTAGQIGINIRNEALGILEIDRPTFEWNQPDGIFIKADDTLNTGAMRTTEISGARFAVQVPAATRHVCIQWRRTGGLSVISSNFESNDIAKTCEVDLHNPSATKELVVFWAGNDVQWNGTQADLVVNRSTAGGPIRVVAIDDGEVVTCNGAGTGITATSTGCYGMAPTGPIGTAWGFQAVDSDLTSIAALVTTAHGRGLLDDADAAASRAALAAQASDADLDDLADGSLSGSKVGLGIVADNITTGTLPDARLSTANTMDSELKAYTIGTTAPVDGSTPCELGDQYLDEVANKVYWCVDAATDDWFGVQLVDSP